MPPKSKKAYSLETELVFSKSNDQYNASVPPLYQSATFKQASLDNMGEYDYTRSGNPTRTYLQNNMARIMKAEHAFAVTSGMGCLDVITRLLSPGDEVIAGDDLYGGTHRLLTYLNNKGDLKVHHHDTTNTELIISKISSATKMIFLESPTNPLIKVVDVRSISKAAHEINPDIIIVFDNTMMSPVLMTPLDLGVDIQYESATKYLNGHHDIMAGIIATRSAQLAERVYFVINSTGCGLSPFDSWLLCRGLKTLAIRVERQQENCQKIAQFLSNTGFKVRYPGLKDHPQHELHKSMCRGFGGVLSFETGNIKMSEKIVENTDIFGIAVSFGCVNSLISMPCKMSHASIDAKTREERDFPEDLIRLCIGIENSDDLIDDLTKALLKSGAVKVNDRDELFNAVNVQFKL
ncbi:cystathionine beta-lyase [Yamadazyma tenuis]|uniref:Cystathionine beta-lyase n=1 Tax=Candida tenuis (strain ATCC 10573 / BCRC 21748 / CBS 615 / JCM 9827 / NBRC 10315 / NRRL Y-1498 / VKM Y-70) TaxID=590646 RepID=G3B8V0_CANTC|nr:cystathionine beta-l [Yamadazyma tenuis ATCC 10573]EGV61779.1 cystathionine beta-l [Yamadazyma tenuis ATCC 10573]WEJ93008.1 cystathionine beta-lyase [Yamadazyma tenuis]